MSVLLRNNRLLTQRHSDNPHCLLVAAPGLLRVRPLVLRVPPPAPRRLTMSLRTRSTLVLSTRRAQHVLPLLLLLLRSPCRQEVSQEVVTSTAAHNGHTLPPCPRSSALRVEPDKKPRLYSVHTDRRMCMLRVGGGCGTNRENICPLRGGEGMGGLHPERAPDGGAPRPGIHWSAVGGEGAP